MTLDEALKANTATGSEDEKYLKVEVRTGWFTKEWIDLSLLQEIKEAI